MDVIFRPAERVIDRQVNKAFDKLDERQLARTQASQVRPVALGRASFTRLGLEVASAGGRVVVRQIPFGSVGDRLGLRTGDVIERVNGQQVRDVASLNSVIVTASGEASRVSASKLTVDAVPGEVVRMCHQIHGRPGLGVEASSLWCGVTCLSISRGRGVAG